MSEHSRDEAPPQTPASAAPAAAPAAPDTAPDPDAEIARAVRRRSRRGFLTGAAAALAVVAGGRWLVSRPEDGGLPWPLRRVLRMNERLARGYFSPARLSATFPLAMAGEPRANGSYGLDDDFDPDDWQLRVAGAGEDELSLTLQDLKALPRTDVVTELRCIEGWSQIVHWTGARFADFVARYRPAASAASYVSLTTPDEVYYVGLDMESALHPQTLLCYEMNGTPLRLEHGAPLRLVIPVKYGIKSIKRIGTIRFTADRPADFWAERGYDWYAGH